MVDDSPILSPEDLARTYNTRSYADTWELVQDYWRVMDYAARRPNLGSQALASRLDLPRSRIRPWVRKPDDEKRPAIPDTVRAIQVAEEYRWIPAYYDNETFSTLSRTVAWIYSGGSIDSQWYVPLFTVGGGSTLDELEALLNELEVGCKVSREMESRRAAEYRPIRDGSVLGRVLSLLGAPVGRKNTEASIRLPLYLDDAPKPIREDFVNVYLKNRGQQHDGKATISFREERATDYLGELADLIADVSGERVTVSGHNIIVSADATRALRL